jgi:hypothetical protein
MRLPNYFLIGAPKCGTTAIYEYLKDHPNVWSPRVKEPNFFNTDLQHPLRPVADEKEYLDLYKGAGENILAAGDYTGWYLYSEVAVPAILKFNPDAKFIVIFRSPVQLLASGHNHAVLLCIQDEPDLEKAWRLQDGRLSGEIPLPPNAMNCPPFYFSYRKHCLFATHTKRILKQIGDPSKLLILLFEDMIGNMQGVYERILDFLDLPQTGRTDFPRHNVRRQHRRVLLSRTLHNVYTHLNRFKRRLGIVRATNIWPFFDKILTKPAEAPALRLEFQQELIDMYREEILELQDIIGRDLRHWLTLPQVPVKKD